MFNVNFIQAYTTDHLYMHRSKQFSLCVSKSLVSKIWDKPISQHHVKMHIHASTANRLNALYKFQGMNKLKNSDRGALGYTIQQVGKKT